MALDLNKLTTESRNEKSMLLDQMDSLQIVSLMNEEDSHVAEAVREVLPQIAKTVTWCVKGVKKGGRIIYIGAGTSGRIGLMDAVECPPTFGVSSELVVGLMAGGDSAFRKAAEGAEDNYESGVRDLMNISLRQQDVVIGLAASGRTPYVSGALKYAKEIGCKTVGVACNRGAEIGLEADLAIEPMTGAEVLTGSTRLKAGTAQKMILNMISTATMVGLGKVYENLMVDVLQSNKKLNVRAENIVVSACGCSCEMAAEKLEEAKGNVKLAIIMIFLGCNAGEAQKRLEEADGHIRRVLKLADSEKS